MNSDGRWEALARELYALFHNYEQACFFCDYKTGSGHAEDCRWDALNRVADETGTQTGTRPSDPKTPEGDKR